MPDASNDLTQPYDGYQYLEVTFLVANTDTHISHGLSPEHPNQINWVPVALNAAAVIYSSPTAPPGRTYLTLRSSLPCTATLLVTVARDQRRRPPS